MAYTFLIHNLLFLLLCLFNLHHSVFKCQFQPYIMKIDVWNTYVSFCLCWPLALLHNVWPHNIRKVH
ncbi:hypothetical protein BD408DRAFT_418873 [Parasitella parasitica]|nr:hypothetical protein BD408DRAFT_418873 [Parasitella parasitica]